MSRHIPDSEFWFRRGLSEPVEEFRFCERLWKFDFAWVDKKVALEIQGGVFIRGAHSRGAAQMGDYAKYNFAQRLGWKVYQLTPEQLTRNLEIERYPKSYHGKRELVTEFLRSVLL